MSADDFVSVTAGFYKPTYELFKQLQDYLKILITLNTATILIMIALLEKILPFPRLKFLVLISFICFAVSLAASLRMMILISRFYAFLVDLNVLIFEAWSSQSPDLKVREAKIGELRKRAKTVYSGKINVYSLANYAYLIGITFLIVFVAINFLSN